MFLDKPDRHGVSLVSSFFPLSEVGVSFCVTFFERFHHFNLTSASEA